MGNNSYSEEEQAALLARKDRLERLLAPFGLKLTSFDPGFCAQLIDRPHAYLAVSTAVATWLEPLLAELLELRKTVKKPSATLETEETALGREVARWDAEDPTWDRDGRLAAAEAGLQRGLPSETVTAIYGPQITAEAAEAQRRAALQRCGHCDKLVAPGAPCFACMYDPEYR